MHELANSAPTTVRAWQSLGQQVSEAHVARVSTEKTLEQEQLADANALVEDLRRLGAQIIESRSELARGKREGTIPADVADAERARLDDLFEKTHLALGNAMAAADKAAAAVSTRASPGIRPLIQADLTEARRLDRASHALLEKLEAAGDKLAQASLERLYTDTRRVLDKARLGKVDAVIGQKRKLDIEVQDLAAGRFPEELIGKMWNASMIADDEEYWPWQGEFWSDEYSGWR